MRARYHNIDIKRFINQGVLTGEIGESQSLNRYAYVEGNPVTYLDPFGKKYVYIGKFLLPLTETVVQRCNAEFLLELGQLVQGYLMIQLPELVKVMMIHPNGELKQELAQTGADFQQELVVASE